MRLATAIAALTAFLPMVGGGFAATTTKVDLVLDADEAPAGEAVVAGVRLKMAPTWHTYWVNPGEAGGPTEIKWSLPPGIKADWPMWPVPEKLNTGGIITYIYHDEVVLLVPLTISTTQPPGKVELKAEVSWFECDPETCIPGKTMVNAALVIGKQRKPSANESLIQTWRAKLPKDGTPLDMKAFWEKELPGNDRFVIIDWKASTASTNADFYPYPGDGNQIEGATERVSAPEGRARLRKKVTKHDGNWPRYCAGVLVQGKEAYDVGPLIASLDEGPSLFIVLGMAFAGGLLLNIMPCVLPIIALKIFSFVNQARETPQRVRLMGLVYGAGVLVSFGVLAGIAVGVQEAGGLASWGMALQNQVVRVVLTIVVTLVALNLFGLFEITPGGSVMGAAGELASREGIGGAFFNGVLATILATPCTAPFLTLAFAFAFTQGSTVMTMSVFLMAGLGLAAPFVALSWHPAWLQYLPKPGPWMERFKIAMGFPMLATAIWLFWFTAPRYGEGGVLWLGLFLVIVAAAAWTWGEFVQRNRVRRGLAIAIVLLLVGLGYFGILERELHWRNRMVAAPPGTYKEGPDGIDWQAWSPEAVVQARATGHPVLVDFTAKTCLNCKFNKRYSLEIPSVRTKLKEINATALLADFTDNDPKIAAELRRHGRPGVPLVLVYPRDTNAPPMVLPPILTPSIVLNALEKAVTTNVNLGQFQSSEAKDSGAPELAAP